MAPLDGSGVDLSLDKLNFDLKSSPTPVKVRGKNGKKRLAGCFRRAKLKRVATSLLPAESVDAPATQRSGKRSRLEQLPVEIIEKIFLECLNVHLPRAAPLIGATLSTPHTYKEFCRRAFCLSVNGPPAGVPPTPPPIQPPVTFQAIMGRQSLIEQERHLANLYRSLALQCTWATCDFFHSFREQVLQSADLWFGKFTCQIPSKLLKRTMSESERHFFLALVTAGATIDPNTVQFELVTEVWKGALKQHDTQVLECLVERGIGRVPTHDERVEALKKNGYSLETLRILRRLRGLEERHDRAGRVERQTFWPDDWPKDWPEADPEVMAATMEKHDIDHLRLSQMLGQPPRETCGVIWRKWEEHFQLTGKVAFHRLPWKTTF